jgi:hypothetical protein
MEFAFSCPSGETVFKATNNSYLPIQIVEVERMSSVGDFATCSKRIEDTPPPFREALLQRVDEQENIRHLIHSPAFATGKFSTLASLLCVTDKRWLIVLCERDGSTIVGESPYDSILLVELTIILLYGQLKIDFVSKGEARSTALQFNTVMKRDYFRAVEDILTAIDGDEGVGEKEDLRNSPILRDWPLKFRNISILYAPKNSCLLGGVQWAEVYGAFHRQLAPAAAILLTQRYIVIIAEEKPGWFQFRPRTNYGQIITYFPINRLAKFEIHRAARFSLLELEGHRGDGGEKLVIMLPGDKEEAVSRLLKSVSASAERVGDDRDDPRK